MILDTQLMFCEDQAITASAISENVLSLPDLGIVPGEAAAIARDLGAGNELPILIQVTETFATLTSLVIKLQTSAAAALTSPTTHWSSVTIPAATLVAGYILPIRVVPNGTMLKYMGLDFVVNGTNATAGKITAALATEQ